MVTLIVTKLMVDPDPLILLDHRTEIILTVLEMGTKNFGVCPSGLRLVIFLENCSIKFSIILHSDYKVRL